MDSDELDLTEDPRKLHDFLLNIIRVSKTSFVLMGKALYYLRRDDWYRQAVGQGADSWVDYLKQPEIGLSVNEAKRLIQIYETFIVRLGYDEETISEIPIKNIHYLLPLVKKMDNKEEADDLVADATLLSQRDFKERIWDKKVEELGIGAVRTYEYLIMRKTLETNTMDKVMEIDSDLIKRTFNLD